MAATLLNTAIATARVRQLFVFCFILSLFLGLFLFANDFAFDTFGTSLRDSGEFAFKIGFDHDTCHRRCEVGTKATMLHIDRDSNFGVIHGSEGDEGRMVCTWILDSACLTTDGIGSLDTSGSTFLYSKTHALYDRGIGFRFHLRLPLREITLVLGVLVNMRHVIPTTIRDGDSEITELEGRTGDITLPQMVFPSHPSL